MTDKEMRQYDLMVEWNIATAEEINLVKRIVGDSWEETIDSISWVRTGYADFDDYLQAEVEDGEEE